MRKAKVAAFIIGGVSTCIFGGIFGFYATSQTVSPVAPNNDVRDVYDVENERLANVAAVTSIRTTANTITSTYNEDSSTAAVQNAEAKEMWVKPAYAEPVYEEPEYTQPVYAETGYTEPVYVQTAPETFYTEPVYTEAVTEAVYEEPVYYDAWYEPAYENSYITEPAAENIYAPSPDYMDVFVPEVSEVYDVASENSGSFPVTDEEYIILCNAVAHEAGCHWIDTYDKAKVVEVIMNRVYSPVYPNSIIDVLIQYNQFSGSESYVYLGTYSSDVSDDVKAAVDLYFSDPSSFSHGYFGFYGDGVHNYFY